MNMTKMGNGIWRVDFLDAQGQRRRLSTKSRDGVAAHRIARDLIKAHNVQIGATGPAPIVRHGLRVDALLDRCMREVWNTSRSQATARSNVRILKQYVGGELVSEMSFTRLDKLRLELTKQGYAPATVKRKITALGKALTMATRWVDGGGRPLLAAKPSMPEIVVENFCDRVISDAEASAIFEAVAARTTAEPMRDWKRYGLLLNFLKDTGCRLGEALRLRENDLRVINVEGRGCVTFAEFPRYTTKNKKPRSVPLTPAIVDGLAYLKAASVDGALFPYRPATAWYMFNTLRKDLAKRKIDVTNVKLHTWRHTRLTQLARSGKVRIEEISDWAGHSNIQITIDRYRHMLPEDKLTILDVITG